jgi:RNA polymerase sigma-70 factor (ECF subfamily)
MRKADGELSRTGRTSHLIRQARAGSRDALGQLLEPCRAYLLLIANRGLDADLRRNGGASDLVQETFVEAQQDFARFQGSTRRELLHWLSRVLQHNLADFIVSFRKRAARDIARELLLSLLEQAGLGDSLALDTPGPADKVVAAEAVEILRRAVEQLPEDRRRVIMLRYQEQLSFEDIAQRMGRTPGAVRKLWVRAVASLRRELGAAHESE